MDAAADAPTVRVGQGFDAHPFSGDAGRRLVLGGVRIPDERGLEGHSDADVVLHATVDALLGAAGLGDIGVLFGSDQPEYEGADSQLFLAGALNQVSQAGWRVGNLDLTLVGQRPRIGPYRDRICTSVANLLGIGAHRVNLKATTTDRLGFTGRDEGVVCMAIVLLHAV